MPGSLLIAYDGSEGSERALDFALDLARRYDASLHILLVTQPPEFVGDLVIPALVEATEQHQENLLRPLRQRLESESVRATLATEIGQPAEQIVRYAEKHAIDHVVVGHRGHSMFDRWLIGSVARRVISHSRSTVTVVR
jgi:nucleotide-binding universal stress UspA family protein